MRELQQRDIVTRAGVRHTPAELGITWDEIEATLRRLPEFVRAEQHWYSIANDLVVGERELAVVRAALDF